MASSTSHATHTHEIPHVFFHFIEAVKKALQGGIWSTSFRLSRQCSLPVALDRHAAFLQVQRSNPDTFFRGVNKSTALAIGGAFGERWRSGSVDTAWPSTLSLSIESKAVLRPALQKLRLPSESSRRNANIPKTFDLLFDIIRSFLLSCHIQPHGAHQFKRVALFDDAGPQSVVEAHPAVLKLVLKMEILARGFHLFDDASEREIVRGH